MIEIKLIKSLAGRNKKHIATAHSLGLKRIGDTAKQPDSPQTRGKLRQLSYLIEITEPGKK
jgi:large subunit ribosomal protein L30